MKHNGVSLQISKGESEKDKKALQEKILKSRQKLVASITKTEMLRVELDMARQEYNARVGKLYTMSNQLDLDIIYYKNILQLMNDGYRYEEAVKKLDETYYGQQRKLEQEKEYMRWEKEIFEKRSESTGESNEDIKKLWKYLVSKFHPDLVLDSTEKKRREEIMKKVNRAYEEQNYNALKQLENEVHVELYEESTLERLTQILVDIENELIKQSLIFKDLRVSYWYTWKVKIAKARKENKDIFIDIERPLLNEIVQSESILAQLKSQIARGSTF